MPAMMIAIAFRLVRFVGWKGVKHLVVRGKGDKLQAGTSELYFLG